MSVLMTAETARRGVQPYGSEETRDRANQGDATTEDRKYVPHYRAKERAPFPEEARLWKDNSAKVIMFIKHRFHARATVTLGGQTKDTQTPDTI